MRITVREALETSAQLLALSGMPRKAAERTAEAIVLADVWGIASHGLMRLPFYLDRLRDGGCNPNAQLRTVADTGPLVTLAGERGIGHWQLWDAAELATERCARFGIAAVGVSDSSHCGSLGIYTLPALGADQVGLVFSNGPAVMPPWEGRRPVLSTSPVAAGLPCGDAHAIVDMATSAVARGKIAAHAQRGEPLVSGWAFTVEGEPTTDATAALAGMLAPLGGAKGYALALMVEALSGGLLGPKLSVQVPDMFAAEQSDLPQGIGHLVIALDPGAFGTGARERLDQLAEEVSAAGGRLPGAARAWPNGFGPDAAIEVADTSWARISDARAAPSR